MANNLAPVVLFVYNRPWHTGQTLKHLMQNDLASESILHIFSDGPKEGATEEVKSRISEVRKIIREERWCREVHIIESPTNKGLANSIIEGVSTIFNLYGKAIILEDDLLISRHFLSYMNKSLDFYEKRKTVFSISADRPPYKFFKIPDDYEYDVFVSLRFFSTGWATWKDRWLQVDWSMDNLDEFLDKPEQIASFNRGGADLTRLLLLQRSGKIDSWAIRFTYAHFINHAVAILPCISYVDNIGFDGSGIHSGSDESGFRKDITKAVCNPRLPDILYEDQRIIHAFSFYYNSGKRTIGQKILRRLGRISGRIKIRVSLR
jgi:hypothetical protein